MAAMPSSFIHVRQTPANKIHTGKAYVQTDIILTINELMN
jgi:hypothetical protein